MGRGFEVRYARGLLAVLAALLWLPASASAIGVLDNLLTITQEGPGGGSMTLTGADLGCSVSGGEEGTGLPKNFSCNGLGQTFQPANPDFEWEISDWNLSGEFDPMLNIGFGFKNTGATATFTIVSSIPVAPLGPTSLMGGSTGGSVTDDGNGVGGLGTATPDPFYVGLIDGAPQAATALLPDPTNIPGAGFPGTFAFGGQTVNIPAVSVGLPGPTIPGPAVAASIGIRHRFQLATQDSVGVSSFFQVVPEPGTASLVALGVTGLALLRRRS